MSMTISWRVHCDGEGCDNEDTPGSYVTTEREARDDLTLRGWTFIRTGLTAQVLCEACTDQGESGIPAEEDR